MNRHEDEVYVYALSNGNRTLFPNNTASDFRNEWDLPIDLRSSGNSNSFDEWEVGVTEIQMPCKFFNVTDGVNKMSIRYKPSAGNSSGRHKRQLIGLDETSSSSGSSSEQRRAAAAARRRAEVERRRTEAADAHRRQQEQDAAAKAAAAANRQ